MMHIGPSCARNSAILGKAITAAIPIDLRAAVKTRLSAVRIFNAKGEQRRVGEIFRCNN
jgi:hypothetical protein